MALRRLSVAVIALVALLSGAQAARASDERPSVGHGLGRIAAGLILEWPATVVDATLTNPPVVGTMMGIFAGVVNAARKTAGGVREVSAGFDPWGAKRRE